MDQFQIIEFEGFQEDFSQLERKEQTRVERFIFQLKEKGDLIGKPLGYLYIREKKFNGKRLYFVIYKEWKTILLWGISGKKDQTVEIQKMKKDLGLLKEFVRSKITTNFE